MKMNPEIKSHSFMKYNFFMNILSFIEDENNSKFKILEIETFQGKDDIMNIFFDSKSKNFLLLSSSLFLSMKNQEKMNEKQNENINNEQLKKENGLIINKN